MGRTEAVCGLFSFFSCRLDSEDLEPIKVQTFVASRSRTLKLISTPPLRLLVLVLMSVCCLNDASPPPAWFDLPFSPRLSSFCLSFPSSSVSPPVTLLPSLPQRNEGDLFHRLWHVMNEILDLRRQVLVGHLTHDRMRDVKQHITARLDWGNE